MRTKLISVVIALLAGMSVWADDVWNYNVYDNCSKNGYETSLAPADVQAVDLGLPSGIKWASCNVGANNPEDYGNYYAWGEVLPKDDYSWSTYKYANGSEDKLTKYCNEASYGDNGFTDSKTTLAPEDDAAHVNWGGNWRMPTSAEIDELLTNCTWEWTTQNGVNGYKVTSKATGNSNSIFLPAAGYRYVTNTNDVGSIGDYWSSSLGEYYPYSAWNLYFSSDYRSRYNDRYRRYGQSVRPVCPFSSSASSSNSYVTLTLYADGCESANVIHCNTGQQINVTAVPNENSKFSQWSDGNTDNPRLVTVTKDEVLKAEFADDPILTVVSADEKLGTVSGAGQFKPNSSCEISATANYGYYFTRWSDGDTNNPRTVVLTKDTTFTAEFAQTYAGKCGENLYWNYAGHTLTISGKGDMYDYIYDYDYDTYQYRTNLPWLLFRDTIDEVILVQGITHIGNYAFCYCTELTSIIIPNTVTSIGDVAFGVCTGLTSVTIPNTVTTIGSNAFASCMALTSLEIPNSVTSIGSWAFYNCTGLTSLVLPNSVTTIGEGAFYDCSGLTALEIPNSVTNIGEGAFNGCTGLKTLVIPNSITDMPANLLGGLSALDSISVPATVFHSATYYEQPSAMSYVELNGDEITDNVLSVLHRNYKTLRTLDISQTTNTTIPENAFDNYYLRTLRLPANLTAIPYMAATECLWLQSITIPASVAEIESRAFENCRSLKSVVFEGATADGASTCALRRIGDWAFYNCHELQNLSIPEGVTEIGNAAFYGCTYLTEITLPSSVTSIDDNAFALCGKIQKIRVAATTPPTLRAKTFYEVNRSIPVYVPAEAVSDYKSDTYWREFNIQSYTPTAIDTSSADTTPRKVFVDGQVRILRNGKTYTVTGQEVK